jgi:RecB family exonuclease
VNDNKSSQNKTGIRTRNLFNPSSVKPFKLSRSRLERFIECPRCFYLDRRLGVDRVSGPAFTLNSATDTLLKREFDFYRRERSPHPIMIRSCIDAIPFEHPELERWRQNLVDIQYHHKQTNFLITGALDDLWIQTDGSLLVVDYKSTSTTKEITLDDKWKSGYKRQMEIYQWLVRKNGFKVSNTGYFLYVNADTKQQAFDGRLLFDTSLIPYAGDDSWVEQAVIDAHSCLVTEALPKNAPDCEWCSYREAARVVC